MRLRDDVRQMLKKKSSSRGRVPSMAAQLREMKASQDRDRKERRRSAKRRPRPLKEKVNEVLLRQQIGGGPRPMIGGAEPRGACSQPRAAHDRSTPKVGRVITDVKSEERDPEEVTGRARPIKAVADLASAPSSAPTTSRSTACARSRRRSALREEDLSPPTPYRTAVVEAPAPGSSPTR